MHERLERASELLAFVTHALDEVSEILQASIPDGLRESSKLVDEATELLLNVEQSVYAHAPDLAPVRKGDAQRIIEMEEYGKLLITTRELFAQHRYDETLSLWRRYLATERGFFYELLAKRMLSHLEKNVQTLTAPPNST